MIKPLASNHIRCETKLPVPAGLNSRSPLVASEASQDGKMKTLIRVLIVDDHPVVRRGVASCLAQHKRFKIVGEAADGQEALVKMKELAPDVVLMDYDVPRADGFSVAQTAAKDFPGVRIIIHSMHRDTDYVLRILQAGARGYVLKDGPPEELVLAVEKVYAGESYFSSDVARVALNRFVKGSAETPSATDLTNREREVLIHIADGFSNKEVACRLNVGTRTVETHRERIMRKLNIRNVAGLTRFAIAKGLVSLQQ